MKAPMHRNSPPSIRTSDPDMLIGSATGTAARLSPVGSAAAVPAQRSAAVTAIARGAEWVPTSLMSLPRCLLETLDSILGRNNVREANTELLVHYHSLAAGNWLAVDEDVEWLACKLLKLND